MYEEMIFKCIFCLLHFVIFVKILEYIANFASEHRGAYLLCQRKFQEFEVVYEEERSWSRVNRTVLKIYGAKSYQFKPTYLPLSTERRTSAKRRKKCFYTMS